MMALSARTNIRKHNTPALKVRMFIDPIIVSGGWFADVHVTCEFFSNKIGETCKFSTPLKSFAAKKLTDLLLHPQSTGDFENTKSEQKRISKYLAETMGGIVARQPEWYRKRGYPLRFTKY